MKSPSVLLRIKNVSNGNGRDNENIFIKKNPTRCNNVSKFYYFIFI
jgi:hypothetical protein